MKNIISISPPPDINQVKFKGFQAFQAAYHMSEATVKNDEIDLGIVNFLIKANSEKTPKRLSRTESRNIQKAVHDAQEKILDELPDENRVAAQMSELLHRNFVAMKLK